MGRVTCRTEIVLSQLLLIDPPHPSCVPFILVFQRCPEAPAGLSPTGFMDRPSCDSGLAIFWTPQHNLETLTITEPAVHPRIQNLWTYHRTPDREVHPFHHLNVMAQLALEPCVPSRGLPVHDPPQTFTTPRHVFVPLCLSLSLCHGDG